jgi:hypothetical protein
MSAAMAGAAMVNAATLIAAIESFFIVSSPSSDLFIQVRRALMQAGVHKFRQHPEV